MSIWERVANVEVKTQRVDKDGDFFLPDVRGRLLITEFTYNKNKDTGSETAVIKGIVQTCTTAVDGAPVHAKGALVKKLYLLTQRAWHAPMLKKDLCAATGEDASKISSEDSKELFNNVFGNDGSPLYGLKGLLVDFYTKTKLGKDGRNYPDVFFKAVPETAGNSEKEIASRKQQLG